MKETKELAGGSACPTPKTRARREKRIAAPEETAELRFRESGRVSEYADLLEELQEAPKGSTLKIAKQARSTALKHIRELGLRVLWARQGEVLYIKIVGEVAAPLTVEAVVRRAVTEHGLNRKPNGGVDALILAALARGPQTLKEAARVMGCSAISCAEALARLMERGAVECEDGIYREVARA